MVERLKIIVAEDNAVQRLYLSKLIESLGYEAIPVDDGRAAIQQLVEAKIQIVISDYQMPNMDGIQLTQAVRALELDHYVYIIMITGSENEELRSKALDAGVDDFLAKTRSPMRLNARIRAATRLIQHADEPVSYTHLTLPTTPYV